MECAPPSKYFPQLVCAKAAARLAGKFILESRSRFAETVRIKSGVDLVTAVDKESERIVREYIHNQFPNDIVIGEEDLGNHGKQGEAIPEKPVWFVDPLDGTTNFVHQYPFVAVSIGYCVDGIPRMGVIYNPYMDKMYEGEEGRGAYCNGKPMSVDTSTGLSDCLLQNNIGHMRDKEFIDETVSRIAKWMHGGLRAIRNSGSAAQNMAHVARGRISCFYEHGYGGPWDVCAGYVLVREAGGVVKCAADGSEFVLTFGKGSICCGNDFIVQEIMRLAGKPKFKLV